MLGPGEKQNEDRNADQPDREACMYALLSHALGVSISFIGPLFIWLTAGKRSVFVERHAKEALNAQIILASLLLACWNFAPESWFALMLSGYLAINTIVCVPAIIAASQGKPYRHRWLPLRLIV